MIGELADAVLSDLPTLPSEKWRAAIRTVRRLADEQHNQVFMGSASEQTVVRDTGWEHTYNRIRPQQALGYLTPVLFLTNFNAGQCHEVLSRTS